MAGISDERVLRKLLTMMNSHIPSRRIALSELVGVSEPMIRSKTGSSYSLDPKELDLLHRTWKELGFVQELKIPIILMADSSRSCSSWRIDGKVDCAVIARLLGREWDSERDQMFLYAPHVSVIRKKLPTTTMCMYLC